MSAELPLKLESEVAGVSAERASAWFRGHGSSVMTGGILLALLYVGRDVLIPVTFAMMLSLLLAPLVRALRRIGLGQTCSVLVTVMAFMLSCVLVAVVLGTQIVHTAENLPRYEMTVQRKLRTIDAATVGRLRSLTSEASRLFEIPEAPNAIQGPISDNERALPQPPQSGMPQPPQPLQLVGNLLKSVWSPVQAMGIVLVVLTFMLLEHESLRDRVIRLAGARDIRSMTLALNDAGERLSRFFVSQFTVNLAFGLAIWACLSLLRVPQALLLGALAGVMRFVPYVGVGIAALVATALAFSIDPGWSLTVATLGVFIVLDIVAGQVIEPHLYGHATGLSPLSVVVAAIFWSSIWGPAGLILSTPLTLCVLVAGRHIEGLSILELALGNAQPLTMPQRFYQRALSGDPHEIITNARAFLKRESLAAYCDRVLIPALHLANLDTIKGAEIAAQHMKIRRVILDVVAVLCNERSTFPRRRHRGSVLEDVNPGRWLRQQREQVSGRWQGPLGVPPGSVVLCTGLGSTADDLATELLVRVLRAQSIDARHFSATDIDAGLPPGADPGGVSVVYLVSAFPSPERERAATLSEQIRELLPRAHVVKVFCPGLASRSEPQSGDSDADAVASSLSQAVELCQSWQEPHRMRVRSPRSQPGLAQTDCG